MAEFINRPQENISKIVEAIKQEAQEKAEEIKKNAEELFKIQKNKLVSTEKDKIIEDNKKKIEQYAVQKRIQNSARINEQRLRKMIARHDMIEKLKTDIRGNILKVTEDPTRYRNFFKKLIVQSLIKLMEKKVELKVMKKDLQLAHQVKAECEKEFSEIVKAECHRDFTTVIVINEDHILEQEIPNILGGVVLTCDGGRIQVVNTLNARIDLAFQEFLPDIRYGLFSQFK